MVGSMGARRKQWNQLQVKKKEQSANGKESTGKQNLTCQSRVITESCELDMKQRTTTPNVFTKGSSLPIVHLEWIWTSRFFLSFGDPPSLTRTTWSHNLLVLWSISFYLNFALITLHYKQLWFIIDLNSDLPNGDKRYDAKSSQVERTSDYIPSYHVSSLLI